MRPIVWVWLICLLGTVLPYVAPVAVAVLIDGMVVDGTSFAAALAKSGHTVTAVNHAGLALVWERPVLALLWFPAVLPAWVFARWVYQRFARFPYFDRNWVMPILGGFIGMWLAVPLPYLVVQPFRAEIAEIEPFLLVALWLPCAAATIIIGTVIGAGLRRLV